MTVIPVFRDYGQHQPALSPGFQEALRIQMTQQARRAGTSPRPWLNPVGAAAAGTDRNNASNRGRGTIYDHGQIRALLEEGKTPAQVSTITGAKAVTIRKLAGNWGLSLPLPKKSTDGMTPEQIAAVQAMVLAEHSHRTIAAKLGCPVEAVKAIVRRSGAGRASA